MAMPTAAAGPCDASHHFSPAVTPTAQGTGLMIIRTPWMSQRIPQSSTRVGEMTKASSLIEVLEYLEMKEDCITVQSQMLTMLYGHSILGYTHQMMKVVGVTIMYLLILFIAWDIIGNATISDVRYDSSSQTLICTSSGGPATSVTWSRDNTPLVVDGITYQQSQVITNINTTTYQNRLRIVAKLASLSGTYTCSVGNSRGETRALIEVSGEPIISYGMHGNVAV
jgi:hypothetical protein